MLRFQSDVEERHPGILKLGLIQGTMDGEEASTEQKPTWLTYAHKLFHDCLAAYHISRKVICLSYSIPNFHFDSIFKLIELHFMNVSSLYPISHLQKFLKLFYSIGKK